MTRYPKQLKGSIFTNHCGGMEKMRYIHEGCAQDNNNLAQLPCNLHVSMTHPSVPLFHALLFLYDTRAYQNRPCPCTLKERSVKQANLS